MWRGVIQRKKYQSAKRTKAIEAKFAAYAAKKMKMENRTPEEMETIRQDAGKTIQTQFRDGQKAKHEKQNERQLELAAAINAGERGNVTNLELNIETGDFVEKEDDAPAPHSPIHQDLDHLKQKLVSADALTTYGVLGDGAPVIPQDAEMSESEWTASSTEPSTSSEGGTKLPIDTAKMQRRKIRVATTTIRRAPNELWSTYECKVEKKLNEKWGLSFDQEIGVVLVVHDNSVLAKPNAVTRTGIPQEFGAAHRLNTEIPERVRVGDVILSVNGECDPSKFLMLMSSRSRLDLVFKRLEESEDSGITKGDDTKTTTVGGGIRNVTDALKQKQEDEKDKRKRLSRCPRPPFHVHLTRSLANDEKWGIILDQNNGMVLDIRQTRVADDYNRKCLANDRELKMILEDDRVMCMNGEPLIASEVARLTGGEVLDCFILPAGFDDLVEDLRLATAGPGYTGKLTAKGGSSGGKDRSSSKGTSGSKDSKSRSSRSGSPSGSSGSGSYSRSGSSYSRSSPRSGDSRSNSSSKSK